MLVNFLSPVTNSSVREIFFGCHKLPMNPILERELFNKWGVEFMWPFVSSYGMRYILAAVGYVSK